MLKQKKLHLKKSQKKTANYIKKYFYNRLQEGYRIEDILNILKIKDDVIINIIGKTEYLKLLEKEENLHYCTGEWTKLKAKIKPNIIDNLFYLYESNNITIKELKLEIKKLLNYG